MGDWHDLIGVGETQGGGEVGIRVGVYGDNVPAVCGERPGQEGRKERFTDAAFTTDRYFHLRLPTLLL